MKLKCCLRIALQILDSSAKNFMEKRNRFIIETKKVMQIQNQYKNIIPIIEYGLPDDKNENVYWYTMPVAIPVEKYFCKIKDIIKVINLLGSMPSLNHMFIPSGGGLDFDFAELAAENGCISLHASNLVYIVKPLKLTVENIQKDFIWSYFRLELDKLEPTGKSVVEDNTEYLTEYLPGRYISWICGNYGYFDNDKPLPKDYRVVTRFLRGCFVLFSKASIYNNISGTYDGRHAKFNSNDFRIYIEQLRQDFIKMNHEDFMEKYDPDPFENSSYMPDTKTIQKTFKSRREISKITKRLFY